MIMKQETYNKKVFPIRKQVDINQWNDKFIDLIIHVILSLRSCNEG